MRARARARVIVLVCAKVLLGLGLGFARGSCLRTDKHKPAMLTFSFPFLFFGGGVYVATGRACQEPLGRKIAEKVGIR